MFFTDAQLKKSLSSIQFVHPFFGISFLTCKINDLPVGRTIEFPIDHKEKEFLNTYYRPNQNSEWFFRVFRSQDKNKYWLRPDYPWKGLQAIRTQTFAAAFIHEKGTAIWGWQNDYVQVLKSKLSNNNRIPAFDLAVWLYRDFDWPSGTHLQNVLDTFLEKFKISEDELQNLFDISLPDDCETAAVFQSEKVSWNSIQMSLAIPQPQDVPPDEGGILTYLELTGVGSAKSLRFEPAERVNLITGDNGLGKTFLLECAWWALSGNWTSTPAYPRDDADKNEPKIVFEIVGESGRPERVVSHYKWESQEWVLPETRPPTPGLLLYARADGAFAIFDPAKIGSTSPASLVFTRENVWDGLQETVGGKTRYLSNGLIRDWVYWQSNPQSSPFETLKHVLCRLSPPGLDKGDLGVLEPGDPIRIPIESRPIPTIKHAYGQIPLVYASAGVRRIVALAYLIVWAWEEHKTQSQQIRRPPQRRMVIIIDEIEAHLHPQWQRKILPALLSVNEDLSGDLQAQFLIATHSPLVLASLEPWFNGDKDKIFHLDLIQDTLFTGKVMLKEPPFITYGTVDSWLRSDIFEMRHARSLEAEQAIEDAVNLQKEDDATHAQVQEVTQRLMKYLAQDDRFWPRWTYFAKQHGVNL